MNIEKEIVFQKCFRPSAVGFRTMVQFRVLQLIFSLHHEVWEGIIYTWIASEALLDYGQISMETAHILNPHYHKCKF